MGAAHLLWQCLICSSPSVSSISVVMHWWTATAVSTRECYSVMHCHTLPRSSQNIQSITLLGPWGNQPEAKNRRSILEHSFPAPNSSNGQWFILQYPFHGCTSSSCAAVKSLNPTTYRHEAQTHRASKQLPFNWKLLSCYMGLLPA